MNSRTICLSIPTNNKTTQLLNWKYLNFTMRVRTTTRLFTIKRKLEERHGRICDLVVCKDSFCEKNEMNDDMMTLEDYGVEGCAKELDPVIVQLFYDFKPCDHDDPLLLVWN
jgi:hypothetical protein